MNSKSKVDSVTDAEVQLALAIDKKPFEDRSTAEKIQLAEIIGRLNSEARFYRAKTDRMKSISQFYQQRVDRKQMRLEAMKFQRDTMKAIVEAIDDDCVHAKGQLALFVGKMKLLRELREGPDRDSLRLPGPDFTVNLQELIRKAEEHLTPLMDDRRTAFAFVQGRFYADVERAINVEIDMEDRRIQKKVLAFGKLASRDAWANEWAHKENLRLSDLKDGADTRSLRRWATARGIDLSKCKRNPARKEFSKAFREEFNVSPDTVMRFLKLYIQ